jgi:molecular chaperone HtpG
MDNNMKSPTPIFGKNIIEMLMFNMYDECKVIYREYIQNSFDAIQQAVEKGVLKSINDGIVNVNIDNKQRTVTIRDNGIGIILEKAPSTLLNIAASEKDGYSQAGQYGVGRLVGAGFCSRIVFRTKAKGDNVGTEVVINSDNARSIIRDKNNHNDAVTVMSEISEVSQIKDGEEHFFEVTLENIKEGYDELLSESEIISYLSAVAPIDYSFQFKNILITHNPEFKKLHSEMKFVKVSINNKPITKRYGLNVIGTGDEILGIDVFHLKDEENELAWGWYAITPFSKEIPEVYNEEIEPNRGIRLRKNNIQIGDAKLLDKFFHEARGNHYFYGEVHVVSPEIVPDSTRQGLASTHEALQLYDLLRNKFAEMRQIYYMANDLKRAVRDLNVGVSKVNSEDDNIDKMQAKGEVEKALATIERTSSKEIASSSAGTPLVEYYQQKSKEIQENGGETPVIKPKKEKATVKIVASDELSPLSAKYSVESIKVIRKIFVLLRKKWDSENKASLEKLIADIIKALK